jgi:hypothetical protein
VETGRPTIPKGITQDTGGHMCRRQPPVVGCSPNPVEAAVARFGPPRYVRAATGSLVDACEPRIAERIG